MWWLLLLGGCACQFTSQTYPDPRVDPLSCRLGIPGPVCDPAAIVSDEERGRLVQRIHQLVGVTSSIRNTSPSCALRPNANLDILVAIIDKIRTVSNGPVDIEKFANNLKRRFQNFQDIGICDTSVLIVNSRQDRQVFTVAGRDARISKETLRKAFERNVGHFKDGRYAMGLEGMVEVIVAAYGQAHIVQTPDLVPEFNGFASSNSAIQQRSIPSPSAIPSFSEKKPSLGEPLPIAEKDKLWVEIMKIAIARCGDQSERLPEHVRAVVEEAMAFSLQLIADPRYNAIEEEVDTHKDVVGVREQAWSTAADNFIVPLYNKYKAVIHAGSARTCPANKIL